jgi:hypothetical protein
LQDYCEPSEKDFVKAGEMYHYFTLFLRCKKQRLIKRKNFNQLLAEEGFGPEHTKKYIEGEWTNSYWVLGLKFKDSVRSLNIPISLSSHISSYYIESEVETSMKSGFSGKNQEIYNKTDDATEIYNILIDRPNKEITITDLLNLGFNNEIIINALSKGDIIEIKPGLVKLN